MLARVPLVLIAGFLPTATAVTCGEIKTFYKNEQCCGAASKVVSSAVPGTPACPYSFTKPPCADAEPQSPRDLTANAQGFKAAKAAVLTDAQAQKLPLANVHFHLGAEHKTEAYSDGTDAAAYDSVHGRRLASGPVRPGFMCPTTSLSTAQKAPYTFQYCKGDVQVGKSYEVHYVHSSAALLTPTEMKAANADSMNDGLGAAANGRGMLNPMVVVEGQVYQIVNGGPTNNDLLHGWTVTGHANSVMYAGSTTGQGHNNNICSPYAITWHVDKDCHQVSPESFDNLCKVMKETHNMDADLYPHGSRKILDPRWVVPASEVVALA
uniref:Uncharacterized protein n=1 Tax=Alexandrium catenella TaxID=2925 RepID=A0A7S1RQI3_ALECA